MRPIMLTLTSAMVMMVAGCAGALKPAPKTPGDLARIAGWHGAAPNSPEAFRFIIVGDRTGGHEEGAWERAIAEVNRLKPDFVLCVGDLIEGYKEDDDTLQQQWAEFDALTKAFDAPFFYCPGNHDVSGDAPRSAYTARHNVSGRTYYSFDYRSCHFVVLDSDAIISGHTTVEPAQWAWLEKDLAAARRADHVFVIYHHPLYDQPQWARMRAMLNPARTTIFTGHRHNLSYDVEDGIPYFVLGPTATQSQNNRQTGGFLSFAHVVVDAGKPAVSIIPVGEVLPHNFIDRHVTDVASAMAAGAHLTPVTRTGGEVSLELAGPAEGHASVTLTWTGAEGWFADGPPASETIVLPTGQSVTRTYRVNPSQPQDVAPVLALDYTLEVAGRTVRRGAKLPLPVIAILDVPRVAGVKIDGDLADWGQAPAHVTTTGNRVTYHPEAWTGPQDCSMTTRLGYDDQALYLAVDVRDDAIVTDGGAFWERDGLEIFWDPRPAGRRTVPFQGPCRQVALAVPQAEGKPLVTIQPAGSIEPSKIDAACVRRPDGYVIELAIPFDAIAEGFAPTPGQILYFEVIVDDMDPTDGKNVLSNMVLSGDDNASRRTVGYARLTFVGH